METWIELDVDALDYSEGWPEMSFWEERTSQTGTCVYLGHCRVGQHKI